MMCHHQARFNDGSHNSNKKPCVIDVNAIQVTVCAFVIASVSVLKHRILHLTLGQHSKRDMSKTPIVLFKPL